MICWHFVCVSYICMFHDAWVVNPPAQGSCLVWNVFQPNSFISKASLILLRYVQIIFSCTAATFRSLLKYQCSCHSLAVIQCHVNSFCLEVFIPDFLVCGFAGIWTIDSCANWMVLWGLAFESENVSKCREIARTKPKHIPGCPHLNSFYAELYFCCLKYILSVFLLVSFCWWFKEKFTVIFYNASAICLLVELLHS